MYEKVKFKAVVEPGGAYGLNKIELRATYTKFVPPVDPLPQYKPRSGSGYANRFYDYVVLPHTDLFNSNGVTNKSRYKKKVQHDPEQGERIKKLADFLGLAQRDVAIIACCSRGGVIETFCGRGTPEMRNSVQSALRIYARAQRTTIPEGL